MRRLLFVSKFRFIHLRSQLSIVYQKNMGVKTADICIS